MTIGSEAATAGERDETRPPVVVAVDGSDRNRSAVAWAAHEVAATGAPLRLVTALAPHAVPLPEQGTSREVGHALAMLGTERDRVVDVLGESGAAAVETQAVEGAPVEVLLEQARGAELLVVGKRGLGGFARLIVGSTSIALAGRSPAPVAIVPDDWEVGSRSERPVVLGVDPFKADHAPAELAFARAARLGVPLVAVHGWEAPSVYSWDAEMVTGAVTEHEREAGRLYDELLGSWAADFPDVVVRPMRLHRHPATAVLEAAAEAQVVVLGRHAGGFFGGFAFGSVARAVLHYAETPVIVVPAEERAL